MKRVYLLMTIAFVLMKAPAPAQTIRDDYSNFLVTAGYQQLIHPSGTYNAFTFHTEVVYSFVGSRFGLTAGPDYFSFSPCGIIMAVPAMFKGAVESLDEEPFLKMIEMITIVSAMQFHIPLDDRFEITAGWDALKFTKLKNYSDHFYITGSLNAGFSIYLGDHMFVNGYYEFNHTHNTAGRILNWMSGILYGDNIVSGSQPDVFKGHSFGVRIGVQF